MFEKMFGHSSDEETNDAEVRNEKPSNEITDDEVLAVADAESPLSGAEDEEDSDDINPDYKIAA